MSTPGLSFHFEDGSAERVPAAFEQARERLKDAIRAGMRQAMQELAEYVVSAKLSGGVLQRRSGNLVNAVMSSVRIKVTDEFVAGSINAKPPKMPNEGYWQEFGTNHPAITGRMRVFAAPDGSIVFTRRTRTFQIAPKPFMNPSLHERESNIMDTIRAKVREANLESL